MLVVNKKLGESVQLGPDIRVKVLAVRSGNVRLGIEAPPTVEVSREQAFSANATTELVEVAAGEGA